MTEAAAVPAVDLPGGVQMPMLGFGTWLLRGKAGREALRDALGAGYRHIDTATMYGNEADVGHVLASSELARDQVFITTKLPSGKADLWLVHWPPPGLTLIQVWCEFLALRDEGRARAIGVSNYSLAQIDRLIKATGQAPAVNQISWSPGRYDAALLAGHRERGVAVEGYSPLKRTNLASPVLTEIAAAHGATPAQVVLRWHLEHGVTVLVKSGHPERIASNIEALRLSLDPDEVARIDALAR
jgi:diketogulonate reductase-like aldo/keto reductase